MPHPSRPRVVATEAPPTYPHHRPVVPACPPPPSVDCRVIRPARRRRCAACCPAAPCRHHAARRSRCAFCRPAAPCPVVPPVAVVYRLLPLSCRPSKLIVESSGVALLSLLLSPLVRRRPPPSYRAAAASLLIIAPPLPSLSCRWFCFRRCATAAILEAMSAVDGCCVTPKFAMIFLSAVTVKLRPFLPVRVPPHASNSSPASPASATRIWMIVE